MGEIKELSENFYRINESSGDTKTKLKRRSSFDLIKESSTCKIKPLCKSNSSSLNLDLLNDIDPQFPSDPSGVVQHSDSWNSTSFGISLKFEDVSYKVRMKGEKGVEKCVVKGLSGSVYPGEVLALMGPSGGGKTTTLNILSGRLINKGGTITYNGQPYTKSLRRRIGYVLQDDTLFPHLTVKETLTYSALLRLPNALSENQKKQRAMNVILELGLESCQNTMIGGNFVRGVSGGERKCVAIANEILLDPSLLFLDEPTTGLDSTTALGIIQMLHNLAKGGKTVVTTIHQPSSRLFSKFDKLILLSNGCSLYYGKASEAMLYFSSIGCSPLVAMNPAEFLIDLANGNVKNKPFIRIQRKDRASLSPSEVHDYLVGAYDSRASKMEKIQVGHDHHNLSDDEEQCGATWSAQMCVLFRRGLKERRHEYLSGLRVVQVVSVSFIVGLLWWNSDATSSADMVQDQEGLLFFISVFWGFFPVFTAIFTFPEERAMLAKERSVNMYSLSAYIVARNTTDVPLDLVLPVVFLAIIYFMVGFNPTLPAFSLTLLSIFLTVIAAQGLGQSIGAAFMDVKKAATVASIIVMTFMLSGGFFVKEVPRLMSWIRYASLNYYTYRLLLKIQHGDSPLIKGQRLHHEVGAMLLMIVGYRFLIYIFLRRMKLRIGQAYNN